MAGRRLKNRRNERGGGGGISHKVYPCKGGRCRRTFRRPAREFPSEKVAGSAAEGGPANRPRLRHPGGRRVTRRNAAEQHNKTRRQTLAEARRTTCDVRRRRREHGERQWWRGRDLTPFQPLFGAVPKSASCRICAAMQDNSTQCGRHVSAGSVANGSGAGERQWRGPAHARRTAGKGGRA